MEWSATNIGWYQQVFLMWILLPPIFLACGLLAFAAPLLYREKPWKKPDATIAPSRTRPDAI